MSSWTITTTAEEDEAITYAYEQSKTPPFGLPPPPEQTVQEFFARTVHETVVLPMVAQHDAAKNEELRQTLFSIPPENRDAARVDLEALVVEHGGTATLRYLWSDAGAPPPAESVTIDVPQSTPAAVTKVFFSDVGSDDVNRRDTLLALAIGRTVQIAHESNAAHYLKVTTTAAPIAKTGYVELPVAYTQSGGPLGAGHVMLCTIGT